MRCSTANLGKGAVASPKPNVWPLDYQSGRVPAPRHPMTNPARFGCPPAFHPWTTTMGDFALPWTPSTKERACPFNPSLCPRGQRHRRWIAARASALGTLRDSTSVRSTAEGSATAMEPRRQSPNHPAAPHYGARPGSASSAAHRSRGRRRLCSHRQPPAATGLHRLALP